MRHKVLAGMLSAALAGIAGHGPAVAATNSYDDLGPRQQREADIAIDAFLDQRLQALRERLQNSPCRMNLLETLVIPERDWNDPAYLRPPKPPANCRSSTGSRVNDTREHQFLLRWRSGPVKQSRGNVVRADWSGNFTRLNELLEDRLQSLVTRKFYPYTPYGAHAGRSESSVGFEHLLADGRTVLGVLRTDRRVRKNVEEVEIQLSVFDVRRLPARAHWFTSVNNYGRGAAADDFDHVDTFSARVEVPAFTAMAKWEQAHGIARRIDPRVLDPAQVSQLRVEPELQALGIDLAQRRWDRMQFVADSLAAKIQREQSRADSAARSNRAWHRREVAAREARWARDSAASVPETNAMAAGIVEGLESAARTQQFWNARAAEAQARYFHAQYGCQPGICGRSGHDNDRGAAGSTVRGGVSGPRGSAGSEAVANASLPATASGSDSDSGSALSTAAAAGNAGSASSAAAATTGGGGATVEPGTDGSRTRTHFIIGREARAGTQVAACNAAKSTSNALSGYTLTGNIQPDCSCFNPGASLQPLVENDRRKRDAATEQWIKDQYTSVIEKREAVIRNEGWACKAKFEVYGVGATPR